MTKNYIDKLSEDYTEIKRRIERGMLPLVARNPAIDKATSEYALAQAEHYESERAKAEAAGRSPNTVPIPYRDAGALERYADLILYEELKWSHPDKMSIVEYPVMSDTQSEEREDKYTPHSDLQYGDRRFNGRRKSHFTDDRGAPQVRNSRIAEARDPSIESIVEHTDLYNALEGAGLTDRQRQAIDLVFFENMTQEATAEAMGVHRRVAVRHLEAGLVKLRNYMTKS